jgi:hypothetical protein
MDAARNIVWQQDRRYSSERGVALIIAMLAMLLFAALGMSIVLTTSTETAIAGNFQANEEGLYVADAALEKVMDDMLSITNWNDIIRGNQISGFNDGPISVDHTAGPGNTLSFLAAAPRTLPDGRTIDLGELANIARCGHPAACTLAELQARTVDHPWGANNPLWLPFAYGPANQILTLGTDDPGNPIAQTLNSQFYVVVFTADDPSENDGDPTTDGQTGGLGSTIALRAESFGPHGVHRVIEATVTRTDSSSLERGYIAQRGEDEQNRRYRKAAVGTPGSSLVRSEVGLNGLNGTGTNGYQAFAPGQ